MLDYVLYPQIRTLPNFEVVTVWVNTAPWPSPPGQAARGR